VLIEPIVLQFADAHGRTAVKSEGVEASLEFANSRLEERLASKVPVVSDAGPGVLRATVQVSEIRVTRPAPGPRKKTYAMQRCVEGSGYLEAKLTDCSSGEVIAAYVGPRKGILPDRDHDTFGVLC
jgi:hypothetical protein